MLRHSNSFCYSDLKELNAISLMADMVDLKVNENVFI